MLAPASETRPNPYQKLSCVVPEGVSQQGVRDALNYFTFSLYVIGMESIEHSLNSKSLKSTPVFLLKV